MDCTTSIGIDRSTMTSLRFASHLLPEKEYVPLLTLFPGINCIQPYGDRGDFFITLFIYENGKLQGKIHSHHCNEKGHIELNLSSMLSLGSVDTNRVLLADYYHSSNIPVELYFAYNHKKTNSYVSYPAGAFVGDMLYPEWHETQLENTLFWPGLISNDRMEMSVVVVNPYKISFSYQLSLYIGNTPRAQSKIYKINPYKAATHYLDEEFFEHLDLVKNSDGKCSICIAAQYKVVAYMMIRDKVHDVYTTIDHLHSYALV